MWCYFPTVASELLHRYQLSKKIKCWCLCRIFQVWSHPCAEMLMNPSSSWFYSCSNKLSNVFTDGAPNKPWIFHSSWCMHSPVADSLCRLALKKKCYITFSVMFYKGYSMFACWLIINHFHSSFFFLWSMFMQKQPFYGIF